MKNKLRIMLMAVLIVIFTISTALLICQIIDSKKSEEIYNRALDIALGVEDAEAEEASTTWVPVPLEGDPEARKMEKIQLKGLRKYSQHLIGWIRIPGTEIDYPLVQGEDNERYLKRTWDGARNSAGAIFMECRNNAGLSDFNTIIYGHNMRNGSMFAVLREYDNENFRNSHPYVYIRTDAGVFRYEIFAAYDAELESPTYGLSFNQAETRLNFLNHALENSEIEAGIEPAISDRFLTLSTCTNTGYSTRWVVQARMEMMEIPLEAEP